MGFRKWLIAASTLMLGIGLTACGTSNATTNSGTAAAATTSGHKQLKVAYVISGDLGDKSFFDSGYAGLQQAQKDFGIQFKVIQSTNASDWEPNLQAAAQGGYDVVIAAASQMHDALVQVAPEFPKTKFVYIDDTITGPNIASVTFAQNEGSFVTGALAALFTENSTLPGVVHNHTIGWVGGQDIAVLHDFLVGFEQGAKSIDPQAKVLVSWAGTFNDPGKGKEAALALYNQGASVVADVAGGTGVGVLEAASDAGKYAIGVDSNEDNLYPGHVLTSQLKNVNVAVYNEIKAVEDGTWKAGHTELGLKNGGVGITDMSVMGDKISSQTRQQLADIVKKVQDGQIVVQHYQAK